VGLSNVSNVYHKNQKKVEKSRLYAEVKKKATIDYIFDKKLKYGQNSATLYEYKDMMFVFKNRRENYQRQEKSSSSIRRIDNVRRTREAIYDLIDCNIGRFPFLPVFLTFTFAENIVDISQANVYFRSFIRRFNRFLNTKLRYVAVLEFQKRGAVHYHTVFFNLPFVHFSIIEKIWSHGFTNTQSVRKIRNLASYLCKYLTKETLDCRLFGEKVYLCSFGLLRPQIERDNLQIPDILIQYQQIDHVLYNKTIIKKYKKIK